MKLKNIFLIVFLVGLSHAIQAREESPFKVVEIRIDTLSFNTLQNMVTYNGDRCLAFLYQNEDEVAEIICTPQNAEEKGSYQLLPSGDFDILDSLRFYGHTWQGKIRFHHLSTVQFPKFEIRTAGSGGGSITAIPLLPCTQTIVGIKPPNDEIYEGEEVILDLISNHPDNILYNTQWITSDGIDYRVDRVNEQLRLHIIPTQLGQQKVSLRFQTGKPDLDMDNNKLISKTIPLEYTFNVKSGRLKYLTLDKRDFTLDENSRYKGVEVQLDNAHAIEMNHTYRIEDQENPGGALIAEIFTRNNLTTNKVLCLLRTYNYHRMADGYLYIKDGDVPLFITNFSITPVPAISKVQLMRDGSDWTGDLDVYPGETIQVKIDGQSLNKAKLHFEDLVDETRDTLVQSDNEINLKLHVPLTISKKRLTLYNYATPTSYALTVKEFEIPRPFDYVYINYGDANRELESLHGPILYGKTIPDLVITFNNDRIDSNNKLYGPQNLTLDVRITGPNNELVDTRTINNIVECPSDRSVRYKYYNTKNCSPNEISLNKYLRRSTNDLDDWSRIDLTFKSGNDKSGSTPQQKDLEIILKKKTKFDVDVSFPAGLVTMSRDPETRKTAFSNLYGISMAMVGELKFYHPDKIAKLRPYRLGAGFLALDAFDFQSDQQDLAAVFLASLYPTSQNKKLAFPIYVGGGYQFKAQKWMVLIGPGISLKL